MCRNGIDFDNQWIEIEKKASPQQQATAATAALLLLKAWSGGPLESQLKEREGQRAPERDKTPLLTALERWGMGPVRTSKSQREGNISSSCMVCRSLAVWLNYPWANTKGGGRNFSTSFGVLACCAFYL
jgi:hypothetical protein